MTLTLRARLTTISTIVFGALLATLAVASYHVLARRLDMDVTTRLGELAEGLHGYLRFDNALPVVAFDDSDPDQAAFVHEATRFYQVYDRETGRLLVESNGFSPLGVQLTPAEVQQFRGTPGPTDLQTEYGRLRMLASAGLAPDHRRYLLQVGVSLVPMDDALARYRDQLWIGLPGAVLLAALAVWWFSGFALRPLSQFATAVEAIDVNALERRLPTRGVDDELDRVAGAFNTTLGRLEHAVGEMRQFSAALAHELRTPLAALRGEIELSMRHASPQERDQRGFVSQIEEIDRLTRLISHILTLARAEAGQIRLAFSPVHLGDLAALLVEQLEPVAQASAIGLRCELAHPAVVQGDAAWLQRMLLNLLDNAIRYTPAGGLVVVRVSQEDQTARIDVEDTGVGLSPADAQQVFARFFRADRARSSVPEGAGLGLSLVQWIVERHRGSVVVDSRPGAGSTFTVRLPSLPQPFPRLVDVAMKDE